MKLRELEPKLESIKIKKCRSQGQQIKQARLYKANPRSTSKPKARKQIQKQTETTSSSSESENDDDQYEKVDDVTLFMKRFQKGLKKQGYKVVKRSFPDKKRRTCCARKISDRALASIGHGQGLRLPHTD